MPASSAWLVSLPLLIVGCVRLGFESQGLSDSGVRSDATAIDVPAEVRDAGADGAAEAGSARPALCGFARGAWHFQTSRLMATSSSAGEAEPRLSADGLTLYFARYGLGTFRVSRASLTAEFSGPVESLAGPDVNDVGFTVSATSQTAWIARLANGVTLQHDIWRMRRTQTTPPTYVFDVAESMLNNSEEEYDPFLTTDELRLYFVTNRVGQAFDIMVAERPDTQSLFGAPTVVAGLDSPAKEDNPSLTNDERVVVFGRPGNSSASDQDIWIAFRSSRSVSFETPLPLSEINTAQSDTESYLRSDGCELFYSTIVEAQMQQELFRAVVVAGPPP